MVNNRYNLTRYNLQSVDRERFISASFTGAEFFGNVVGHSVTISGLLYGYEAVHLAIRVFPILCGSFTGLESVGAWKPSLSLNLLAGFSAKETVGAAAVLGKHMLAGFTAREDIRAAAALGRGMQGRFDGKAYIGAYAAMGRLMRASFTGTGIIGSFITAKSVYYTSMLINVTIPPGGELRLDSELFNATLNGANVLHLVNGEWVFLSPRIRELRVNTGTTGALKGEVIFRERYL